VIKFLFNILKVFTYICGLAQLFGLHIEDEVLYACNLQLPFPDSFAKIIPRRYLYNYNKQSYFVKLLLFSVSDNFHKCWQFLPPNNNQGDMEYESVIENLDKISGSLYFESVTSKSTFYNVESLKKNKIKTGTKYQTPETLIVTMGAPHQGYGMVCTSDI